MGEDGVFYEIDSPVVVSHANVTDLYVTFDNQVHSLVEYVTTVGKKSQSYHHFVLKRSRLFIKRVDCQGGL